MFDACRDEVLPTLTAIAAGDRLGFGENFLRLVAEHHEQEGEDSWTADAKKRRGQAFARHSGLLRRFLGMLLVVATGSMTSDDAGGSHEHLDSTIDRSLPLPY